MKIKFLPAFNGDCFIISFLDSAEEKRNILVDGGTPRTYRRHLEPELRSLKEAGEFLDLLLVTHIDDDHIGGIKELYQDSKMDHSLIKRVWFNSGILLADFFREPRREDRTVKIIMDDQSAMSVGQGITLERALINKGNWDQKLIHSELPSINFCGAIITILSPGVNQLKALQEKWEIEVDKTVAMSGQHDDFHLSISALCQNQFEEDSSIPNGSSIAFLIEHENSTALLLGDAHPTVVEKSIRTMGYSRHNKLKLDLVKVSHHSSKKNTSPQLLSVIESSRFMISSDGSKHGLPDKEAMARIVEANPGCELYFNYDTFIDKLFSDQDHSQFNFSTHQLAKLNYTIKISNGEN